MPYQVFDNGKPADCHHHKMHGSWEKSSFDTLEEAEAYANNWLGIYGQYEAHELLTGVDYSGYGDVIQIKKVENE